MVKTICQAPKVTHCHARLCFFDSVGSGSLPVGFSALHLTQKHKTESSYRFLLVKHELFIEEMELFKTELIFLRTDFL